MEQKDIDRFFKYVNKKTGSLCWEWIGYINKEWGYGNFNQSTTSKKLAHRFSWEIHNGPIPEGMLVCHSCDNPSCVNPSHLFLGTHKTNMEDKVAKDRQWKPKGMLHSRRKLKEQDIEVIFKKAKQGRSGASIAKEYKVNNETIYAVLNGRTWSHLGLKDKYE